MLSSIRVLFDGRTGRYGMNSQMILTHEKRRRLTNPKAVQQRVSQTKRKLNKRDEKKTYTNGKRVLIVMHNRRAGMPKWQSMLNYLRTQID